MKQFSLIVLGTLCQVLTCVAGILPSPTITQSATPFSASYVGANLFDSVLTTEYASQSKGAGTAYSTTLGTWLQFDFGAPVTMDRVLLMTRGNAVDVIGNYRMIFSNDATFDAADTVFTLGPAGSSYQAPVKSFTATTARYVRWEVATSTGSSPNLGGAEMRFLTSPAGSALISPVTAYAGAAPFNASYALANSVNGDAGRGAGLEYACASLGAGMYVDFDMGSIQPINGFDFFDRVTAVDRTTSFNLI